MAHHICEQCGTGFMRSANRNRSIRFCNQACYHAWRKIEGITGGQFQKGKSPWNKGTSGLHLSPATEFKPGRKSLNKASIGDVRIRSFKRSGKQAAFVKVADPNVWRLRCHVVWESAYGPIPKGLLVHHADRNPLNDNLTNLVLLNRAAHLLEHRPEFEGKRLKGLRSRRHLEAT